MCIAAEERAELRAAHDAVSIKSPMPLCCIHLEGGSYVYTAWQEQLQQMQSKTLVTTVATREVSPERSLNFTRICQLPKPDRVAQAAHELTGY